MSAISSRLRKRSSKRYVPKESYSSLSVDSEEDDYFEEQLSLQKASKRNNRKRKKKSRIVVEDVSSISSDADEEAYLQEMMSGKDTSVASSKKRKRNTTGRRATKRRKISYTDGDDILEYEEVSIPVKIDDEIKIDKILGRRINEKDHYEYCVKYANRSYLHLDWLSKKQIEDLTNGKRRLSNFIEQWEMRQDDFEGAIVNPNYTVIERIIGRAENFVPDEYGDFNTVNQYFVKFKQLDYIDNTWEDVDYVNEKYPELVERFERNQTFPTGKYAKNSSIGAHAVRSTQNFDEEMPIPEFNNESLTLRDYQESGFRWLVFSWLANRNTILADEMGLGKTIQTIAMLHYLNSVQNIRGPFLVVVPMSCLSQWKREIEMWTQLNVVVYHGDQESRSMIVDTEFHYSTDKKLERSRNIYKFNVLVTTYELALRDASILKKPYWKYMVVDEAHRLKNPQSKLYLALSEYEFDSCLFLTGTPIQNDLQELYTLLSFLEPNNFGSYEEFDKKYGNLETKEQVLELQEYLRPYMLRRMKQDVALSIPPKEETLITVELTNTQKQYYRAVMDKNRDFLCAGMSEKSKGPSLRNVLMEQRKICNHPFLIKNCREQLTDELSEDEAEDMLVKCCAKTVLLDKLLKRLRKEGHKVLIFSQMVRLLDILAEFMEVRDYPYERLDGRIGRIERQEGIDRFNFDPNSFAFLLSTKAGGLGLNLTAADTVILYDSDWNPQNDIQAQARCHRIGQTREVKIYRLITDNSYEMKMFDVASKKLGLNRAILGSSIFAPTNQTIELEDEDVEKLLRHGAYDIYKENDNEKENRLMTEDIESILSRAETVVYDDKDGMKFNFSKTSFVASSNDESINVDVDDENFWQKLIPEIKNVKKLQSRFGIELKKDKPARIKLLSDINELIDETMRATSNKSAFIIRKSREELISLINRIKQVPYFTKEDKAQAGHLLDKIEVWNGRSVRMSRRNRRRKTGDVDYIESRRNGKPKVPKDPKAWNKTKVSKFKRSFLSRGFGQWEDIIKDCQFEGLKNVEEIRTFGENFVSQLFYMGGLKEKEVEEGKKSKSKDKKRKSERKRRKKKNKKAKKKSEKKSDKKGEEIEPEEVKLAGDEVSHKMVLEVETPVNSDFVSNKMELEEVIETPKPDVVTNKMELETPINGAGATNGIEREGVANEVVSEAPKKKKSKKKKKEPPVYGTDFIEATIEEAVRQTISVYIDEPLGSDSSKWIDEERQPEEQYKLTFVALEGKPVEENSVTESQQLVAGNKVSIKIEVPTAGDYILIFDLNRNERTGNPQFVRSFPVSITDPSNLSAEVEVITPGFLSKYYIRLYRIDSGKFYQFGNILRMYIISHPLLETPDFLRGLGNTYKNYQNKLSNLLKLRKILCEGRLDDPPAKVSTKLPAWWWIPELHDSMLLLAVDKLGHGAPGLQESHDFIFSTEEFKHYLQNRKSELEASGMQGLDTDEWPSLSALVARTNQLINAINKGNPVVQNNNPGSKLVRRLSDTNKNKDRSKKKGKNGSNGVIEDTMEIE
eukprot:TRINITY_DN5809_c1_g1_i1.p1 TRINITY_DN5809_c1_g1~~TRINITY_DN5809_c1_g1_i1.p1  ORF type:complete len:1529 (-),score=423.68 TRINITY_DN5809_c1_g1_i1:329-4915(-)